VKWLVGKGFPVWYDQSIIPCEIWWSCILKHIDQCAFFVIFLSNASNDSKWVYRELLWADKRNKDILPIFLEEVELKAEIESLISNKQYLFRYKQKNRQYLIVLEASFKHLLGTQRANNILRL